MRQETLTVLVRVGDDTAVRAALGALGGASGPLATVFATPDLRIHFARVAWLEEPDGGDYPSSLVLESNFDTPVVDPDEARREHLDRLAHVGMGPLAALLAGAEDVDTGTPARLGASLAALQVPATAAYQGHTERDLDRIRLERRLREIVLEWMSTQRARDPGALLADVRAHVISRIPFEPSLSGLDLDAPAPPMPDGALRTERLIHRLMPWAENARPVLPILSWIPRILEWQSKDVEFDLQARLESRTPAEKKRYREIAASEDHGVQNALTLANPLRPGAGRLEVLTIAHRYIDALARNYFDDIGNLGGIPTIHFAKWCLIDGGKRLLFLSNYDGSWESYLGDFVDNAAIGLNLAWACTEEYPHTCLLGWGGADDEERFKAWSRAYQRPTAVFYSAYPELSIVGINNATWIRAGLHRPGPADLDAWFRRLT